MEGFYREEVRARSCQQKKSYVFYFCRGRNGGGFYQAAYLTSTDQETYWLLKGHISGNKLKLSLGLLFLVGAGGAEDSIWGLLVF